MANANRPWGLKPVKSLIAGDWDGRGNVYNIVSTDSISSYHIGDVVKLSGTGDANGIPGVTKFSAGDSTGSSGINGGGPVGVIVAIGTNPTATTSSTFLPFYSVEYFKIAPGSKIAAIKNATAGTLYVTECE